MIHIRLYCCGEDVVQIRVSGHAHGVMGDRACIGVSVLSRTLLHALGLEDLQPNELVYGNFLVELDRRRRTQAAAKHTVIGYRLIASIASDHVRIKTIEVGDVS